MKNNNILLKFCRTKFRAKKNKKYDESQNLPIIPDQLSLELGSSLSAFIYKDKGKELSERIEDMSRQITANMGITIPKIKIVENKLLNSSEYCTKIWGVEAGKSSIRIGSYLCIDPGNVKKELSGEKTKEPAFGHPAIWIEDHRRKEAKLAGYTIADPECIITTHLAEIIKRNITELLGRQEALRIIEGLKKDYSAVVDEMYLRENDGWFHLGNIKKILHGLLKEQVSIRNTVTIMEAIADFVHQTTDVQFLTERVREALGNQICQQYVDKEHTLHVLTLDPSLEQKFLDNKAQDTSGVITSAIKPSLHASWIRAVGNSIKAVNDQGYKPVILCSSQARYLVRTALNREFPEAAVLSVSEITDEYKVESIGVINLGREKSRNKTIKKKKSKRI